MKTIKIDRHIHAHISPDSKAFLEENLRKCIRKIQIQLLLQIILNIILVKKMESEIWMYLLLMID